MPHNSVFFQKTLVAITGLFLCIFLVIHLSANCILLLPEEMARGIYNAYSTALRESLLTKVAAYVLYLAILLHVLYALRITLRNRRDKTQRYLINKAEENSSWPSRNMGVLGGLILIFLVVHLVNFWARIKLGFGEPVGLDANGNKDVYEVTYSLFQNIYYVLFYTIVSVPLAQHLHHGIQAGFKTLGFYHRRGLKVLAQLSLVYAVMMGIGFGIIPLAVYFKG